MRLHRFIGSFDLDKKSIQITDLDLIHQWRKVLRLSVGDNIILVNQDLKIEAKAKILNYYLDGAEVEIGELKKVTSEPNTHLTLYCAVLKKENFEIVVQKATEVGVSEIVPIMTERTVKQGLRYDRLKKIAMEAAEQSGRAVAPAIREAIEFTQAIPDGGENYFFHTVNDNTPTFSPNSEKVGVFIGPEGGWTEAEVALALERGFHLCSLGPRVLRGETAAIVACYLATL